MELVELRSVLLPLFKLGVFALLWATCISEPQQKADLVIIRSVRSQ